MRREYIVMLDSEDARRLFCAIRNREFPFFLLSELIELTMDDMDDDSMPLPSASPDFLAVKHGNLVSVRLIVLHTHVSGPHGYFLDNGIRAFFSGTQAFKRLLQGNISC